jgi:hypothetical protein
MSRLDNLVASPFPEHADKIIYNFQDKLIKEVATRNTRKIQTNNRSIT